MNPGAVMRVTKTYSEKYTVPSTCQQIDITKSISSKLCTDSPHT